MAVNVFTSGTTTSNGTGAYVKTRIPAIVKTGSTLVAFCEGRRIDDDFGDIEIIASRSTDGGATWTGTDCIRVVDNGSGTAGNPAPVVNGAGDIVLLYITQNSDPAGAGGRVLNKIVSTDAGASWGTSTSLASIQDPTWTWCATGPCHGIRLQSGPYAGRLVVTFNAARNSTKITGAFYSDNDGATWFRGNSYESSGTADKVDESSVAELTDGRLVRFNRNEGTNTGKLVSYSSNGGVTWTTPVNANITSATQTSGSGVQGSVITEAHVAGNPLYYATPEVSVSNNRMNLRILRSTNGGTTWDLEHFINSNAAYSDMVVTGPGKIGILYEQGVSPQYQFIKFEEITLSSIHQVGTATTANTGGVDNTSLTISAPPGVAPGNVLVAAITTNNAAITAPAGWSAAFSDAGTNIRTQLFTKVCGSEPANYAFTCTGARPILGTITAWSGVDNVTPMSGTATPTVNTGAAEPQTTPSVTTNTADRGLVMYVRSSYNSNATTVITHSTAAAATKIADNNVLTAFTSRSHGWFINDSEFSGNGSTKAGIAITGTDTEEGTILQTFVLQASSEIFDTEYGVITESEFIQVSLSDTDSGSVSEEENIVQAADFGTIGVVDGVAKYTGDGIHDAAYYINLGGFSFANVRTQFRVVEVEEGTNSNGAALRFRRLNESNYWEFGHDLTTSTYVLRKKVSDVFFVMAEPGTVKAAGDIVMVEAFEERINCYVNGTLVASITDTDLIEGTDAGIRFTAGSVDTAIDDYFALELLDDIRDAIGDTHIEYEVFVDWDDDGGFHLGDFEIEENLDQWTVFGSNPPLKEQSQTYFRSGNYSMHLEWRNWNLFQFDVPGHGFSNGAFGGPEYSNPDIPFKFGQASQGFDDGHFAVSHDQAQPDISDPVYTVPGVYRTFTKQIPGRVYDLIVWVYVPSTSDPVSIGMRGILGETTSTTVNEWEKLVFTYQATAVTHDALIYSDLTNPASHTDVYIDEIMVLGAYEDITCYVILQGGDITFREGRDQARSLASISPGDVELTLNNRTQIFSPDNDGGVLFNYLAPGKSMMIRATHNDRSVNIFQGFVDNYVLNPDTEDRSVSMSCMDALQWLSNTTLNTELYPSIQTGEAVNIILDVAGWPADRRDIDQGATTMRWWWEDGTNGLDAIQSIVESEGMPANAFVDQYGNFVFRGRHHRFLRTRSKATQVTVRACVEFDEPNFSAPVTYDIGWKDIINKVEVDIEERLPIPFDEIWNYSEDEVIAIKATESFEIIAKPGDPFYGATLPSVADKTIVLQTNSGSIASINMTETSGQSTTVTITAGVADVTIKKLSIKGFSVPVYRTRKIRQENTTSITKYGPQANQNSDFPWAGVNDMDALATIILGQRADRLAVVYININNGNPIRISNILNRDLSDRIHLIEQLQTFMNDDYFIEVLEHTIENDGTSHLLKLGCEKARDQLLTDEQEIDNPIFTFDVAGQGFDDGYFSNESATFTGTDKLFILDQSRLDEDGLGY